MNAAKKYGKSYFMPPQVTYDWVKKGYDYRAAHLVQCGLTGWKPGPDRAYELGRKAEIF